MQHYGIFDIVQLPLFLIIILLTGRYIQQKHIAKDKRYEYFLSGLFIKLTGALALCLVYTFYYSGGDTLNYHYTAKAVLNLLYEGEPEKFLSVWLGPNSVEKYYYFNNTTGYPAYWDDSNAFNVARIIVPLELITGFSYPVTSLLCACIGYSGLWKLYLMFSEIYPPAYKRFAIAILFVPSVIFWGSGILKDTFTIAGACWFCYSFYRLYATPQNIPFHVITLILSILGMISTKPYVFVALLPGTLIWITWERLKKIQNLFIRALIGPFIIAFSLTIGVGIWNSVSTKLGAYSSVDTMVEKVYVSQQDLKSDYYQGNAFDLGDYAPTLAGSLTKFPEATMAGLFRPFIWESKNVFMLINGLENLIFLSLTIWCIFRNPGTFIKALFTQPTALFCFLFAIVFAFWVGLSTSNFGALVRLRIPMVPFYLCGLIIVEYISKKKSDVENVSL